MLSYESLRTTLLARRRDLFLDAAQTAEELRWLESDGESEVEERGQEANMIRLLDRLESREKQEIEAIDRALIRIELGRYGSCEGCGKEIPLARLKALPATVLCIGCAEVGESQGMLRRY
jgi:DnaK suppressor protein